MSGLLERNIMESRSAEHIDSSDDESDLSDDVEIAMEAYDADATGTKDPVARPKSDMKQAETETNGQRRNLIRRAISMPSSQTPVKLTTMPEDGDNNNEVKFDLVNDDDKDGSRHGRNAGQLRRLSLKVRKKFHSVKTKVRNRKDNTDNFLSLPPEKSPTKITRSRRESGGKSKVEVVDMRSDDCAATRKSLVLRSGHMGMLYMQSPTLFRRPPVFY